MAGRKSVLVNEKPWKKMQSLDGTWWLRIKWCVQKNAYNCQWYHFLNGMTALGHQSWEAQPFTQMFNLKWSDGRTCRVCAPITSWEISPGHRFHPRFWDLEVGPGTPWLPSLPCALVTDSLGNWFSGDSLNIVFTWAPSKKLIKNSGWILVSIASSIALDGLKAPRHTRKLKIWGLITSPSSSVHH